MRTNRSREAILDSEFAACVCAVLRFRARTVRPLYLPEAESAAGDLIQDGQEIL